MRASRSRVLPPRITSSRRPCDASSLIELRTLDPRSRWSATHAATPPRCSPGSGHTPAGGTDAGEIVPIATAHNARGRGYFLAEVICLIHMDQSQRRPVRRGRLRPARPTLTDVTGAWQYCRGIRYRHVPGGDKICQPGQALKVNRVGEPVKSLESNANTHAGSSAKALLTVGSSIPRS